MIAVDLDIARPRVTRTVEAITAQGNDWETGSGVLVDPVAKCLMLRPFQLTPEWDTTFTGDYVRLSASDFETAAATGLETLTSEWGVNQRKGVGDFYLENFGSINYPVFTKTSWPINRPFFLEWYVPHGRGKDEVSMECGWGTPEDPTTVSLRISSSGNAEVWKGTTRLGVYSISKLSSDIRQIKKDDTELSGPTGSILGKLVSIYLVPILPRMLLCFSSNGGGFVHTFGDLAQASGANVITSADRFWWRVAQGKASVQCAPLTFPESGHALRRVDSFLTAPPTGTTFVYTVRGSYAGYGTGQSAIASIADTGGIAFVPNGSATDVRLRVDFTGDGSNTPFVFSAAGQMDRAVADTDDSEQTDIADHTRKLSLSVGRDDGRARGSLLIGDKDSLTVAGIRTQSNRPLKLRVSAPSVDLTDATTLLVGATGNPSTQQVQTDVEGTGVPITIPFTDLWTQLEGVRFEKDGVPFDGYLLTAAIEELLIQGGVPTGERDIGTSTLPIPFSWTLPLDYKYQPKAGDSVAKWLQQLHKDFAPTWYMGFYPTATGTKFRFRSRADMGTTPKATIWLHRDNTGGRIAARDFKEDVLPPEATRITVYGFDPGTKTFLRAGWVDSSLEDPTVAPSARPTGWRGQRDPLVVVDERLTTAAAVLAVRDELVDRVATVLNSAQWKSDLLVDADGVPLWIGDVVRVKTQAGTTHGDYRIESISMDLRREVWRDCSYAGVKI